MRGGGRIALSLHPKLVLSDVTLSNAPWGSAPQMLTAQRVELEVALLPLLSRRFELIEFALVGPVIALESNAKGEKNWEFGPAPGAPASTPGAPAAAMVFGVGNVEVTNGTLTYRDGGSGDVARVAIDRLFLRARDPAAPVVAEFRGKVNEVALAVEGTLGPLEALLQKRWPYPVNLQGEVAGRKAALATKLRAEDKLYTFDELRIAFGANALTGSLTALAGDPRPKLTFALSGPALMLNELPLPATAAAPAPATKGTSWFFPDVPVDFALLRLVDAEGTLAIGRLTLPSGAPLENFRVQLALAAGKLDVPSFSTGGMGWHACRRFRRGCQSDPAARRCRRISTARASRWARCWPPPACIAKCAEARPMSRSISRCAARRRMRGRARPPATCAWWPVRQRSSTRRSHLAAPLENLLGSNQSVPCHRSIDRARVRGGPAAARQRHGPRRSHDCMETAKLGVSASGTLDFRNETLDLGFQPKVRKGLTVPVPNFANLVRFVGPFRSPHVQVDTAGSAAAIASIGAAIGTGGWSLLGQTLLSWAEGSGPGPCQVALGAPAANAPAQAAKGDPATDLANEVGKAVGKLFGK